MSSRRPTRSVVDTPTVRLMMRRRSEKEGRERERRGMAQGEQIGRGENGERREKHLRENRQKWRNAGEAREQKEWNEAQINDTQRENRQN